MHQPNFWHLNFINQVHGSKIQFQNLIFIVLRALEAGINLVPVGLDKPPEALIPLINQVTSLLLNYLDHI